MHAHGVIEQELIERGTQFVPLVRGDFEDPVPPEEVVEKFVALASRALGAERAREVVELAHRADALKDVRELTARLAPPS